jgi:hypothetical protein
MGVSRTDPILEGEGCAGALERLVVVEVVDHLDRGLLLDGARDVRHLPHSQKRRVVNSQPSQTVEKIGTAFVRESELLPDGAHNVLHHPRFGSGS